MAQLNDLLVTGDARFMNPVNSALIAPYGICNTAGSTAEKAVTITNGTFKLQEGAFVYVKFTNGNTSLTPTININSTGAKTVKYNGSSLTNNSEYITFLQGFMLLYFDGTSYNILKTENNVFHYRSYCYGETLSEIKDNLFEDLRSSNVISWSEFVYIQFGYDYTNDYILTDNNVYIKGVGCLYSTGEDNILTGIVTGPNGKTWNVKIQLSASTAQSIIIEAFSSNIPDIFYQTHVFEFNFSANTYRVYTMDLDTVEQYPATNRFFGKLFNESWSTLSDLPTGLYYFKLKYKLSTSPNNLYCISFSLYNEIINGQPEYSISFAGSPEDNYESSVTPYVNLIENIAGIEFYNGSNQTVKITCEMSFYQYVIV